ncbi:nitrate reductase molybdenum cofactor assembly chaperone [Nocardia sp. NPDC050793]|uniref:nitrate reductase molybdenum cofactor assembly chaperone n=1 Tax=Nocardia sp. NPDC050793 TaxID=3155159 RepID=UPI0033FFCEC5
MTVTDNDRRIAWQAQSLLMAYPDDTLVAQLPLLKTAAAALPAALGQPLGSFCDHVRHTTLTELAADYVATFDHHKRFSPYLTYFTHGDTRKRGMALLSIKRIYRTAGLVLDETELPDHLAVVLEFAATADPATGLRLLIDYRAGVELLRLGLQEIRSPWAPVLDSICATLPPLRGEEDQAVARLAAQGPPEEEVGLAPFAPPDYMPQGAHQ